MDFGARYNGYCSDMTRTVFVGKPNAEVKNIYEIVLKAQKHAIKNLACGMSGAEGHALAAEIIDANGYGEYFTHGLGHSLGLDIHEEPRLSPRYEQKLQSNVLITVEPGIYVPNVGGVRIEDLLVIKEDRVIDLTSSEKILLYYRKNQYRRIFMILAGDLRKGITFVYENNIYIVVDFCTSNRAKVRLS